MILCNSRSTFMQLKGLLSILGSRRAGGRRSGGSCHLIWRWRHDLLGGDELLLPGQDRSRHRRPGVDWIFSVRAFGRSGCEDDSDRRRIEGVVEVPAGRVAKKRTFLNTPLTCRTEAGG